MQKHHHTFAIAAVLIIAASFAYLAVVHNRQVGSKSGMLPNQQYVSTTYGFSFEYPPQYRLNEYTDRYIELQAADSGAPLAAIEVELADPILSPENYEDFAHDSAKNTCAADGPTGSIRCTDVLRPNTFTSTSGALGESFYLTNVYTTADTATTSESGPYFAFNISQNAPQAPYAAILVRVALGAYGSASYEEAAVLAQSVARSMRVVGTATH